MAAYRRKLLFSKLKAIASSSRQTQCMYHTTPKCGSGGPRLLLFPPTFANEFEFDHLYSIGGVCRNMKPSIASAPCLSSTARCIASTHGGWLIFFDVQDDCSLYLSNPFSSTESKTRPIRLPPIESLPGPPFLGVKRRLKEGLAAPVATGFSFFDRGRDDVMPDICSPTQLRLSMEGEFALSSDPLCDDNCILMANINGYLACCRPDKDMEWTALSDYSCSSHQFTYNRAAFSEKNKLLYSISMSDDWFGIDSFDLQNPHNPIKGTLFNLQMPWPYSPETDSSHFALSVLESHYNRVPYLVVDKPSGDVLVVVRYFYDYDVFKGKKVPPDTMYKVFRVDSGAKDEEKIKELECLLTDRAIFLSRWNESFVLSTRDFPELIPNSIYFTDGYNGTMGSYNLEDKCITPFRSLAAGLHNISSLSWMVPPCD